MRSGFRPSAVSVVALCAAASLVIHADATPTVAGGGGPAAARNHAVRRGPLHRGARGLSERVEAVGYVARCAARAPGSSRRRLRVAEFDMARREAETLVKIAPRDASALALYGDALWASGLFEESEAAIQGRARAARPIWRAGSTAWRGRCSRATSSTTPWMQAQAALRLSPRDLEIHHTVGAIYERMHKYEEAAVAYGNYVNLLPNKDTSEKAAWSRAEIRFLRSFAQRVPFETDPGADDMVFTVDFRTVNEKIVVRARVNDVQPAGFRRRHRGREHGDHRSHRAAAWRHADHVHAERRRGRDGTARSAARAHRLARARHAEAAQRARAS